MLEFEVKKNALVHGTLLFSVATLHGLVHYKWMLQKAFNQRKNKRVFLGRGWYGDFRKLPGLGFTLVLFRSKYCATHGPTRTVGRLIRIPEAVFSGFLNCVQEMARWKRIRENPIDCPHPNQEQTCEYCSWVEIEDCWD